MAELRIFYGGPRDSIEIAGFGRHMREEIKPYPDAFARELVKTSRRQVFRIMDEPEAAPNKAQKARSPKLKARGSKLKAESKEGGDKHAT